MKKFLVCLCLLTIFATSQYLLGNTYYISVENGNDENDGFSISAAWKTIEKANSELQPGDTVYITAGTYQETIVPNNSGKLNKYIRYSNYQNDEVIITGVNYGVDLRNKHFIEIDGLRIKDTTTSWVYMHNSTSTHNIIKNCYMSEVQTGWAGIWMGGSSSDPGECNYNSFINNTFIGICHPENLVQCSYGSSYNIIEGNSFHYGPHVSLELQGWGSQVTGNIIRNNSFQNLYHTAINVYNNADGNIIENNYIVDSGENHLENSCGSSRDRNAERYIHGGIYIGSSDNIVRGNILINNGCFTIESYSYPKAYNNRVYNNTIYKNYRGLRSATNDDVNGNIIKNNILYENREFEIRWNVRGNPRENSFISNSVLGAQIYWYPEGYAFILDLQNEYPAYWQANMVANPMFVNEGARNLHLQATSPLIDSGAFLTVTTNSGGSTSMQVDDASYFSDGFGIVPGDTIQLEGETQTARILSINSNTNTLILDTTMFWSSGQGISLQYSGYRPDIGAYEYESTLIPMSVNINASPSTGYSPLDVNFTASTSGGTSPYTFSWDFGDGSTSSDQNPSHTYSEAGDYPVILSVTDNNNEQDTASLNISVSQQVVAMQATANASPASGTLPFLVEFTADATGGVSPYTYSWDFGDGSSSSEQNPTHTYTSAGDYTALLTVTDSLANEASASVNIRAAENIPPLEVSANATPSSGIAPLAVSFTGNASGGVEPYTYSWDFGDGSSSTLQNPSHTYSQSGNFTAKLTVIDNQDTEESETTTISVTAETAETQLSISAVTDLPAPGWGGTTEPQTGNHSFITGESVNISANPNKDYRFAKWTGDISSNQAYEENISLTMDQNKNIQAHFYTRCGDVNGDLKITPTDAQRVFELFLGLIPNATEAQLENADVNTDGTPSAPKVTPSDAQAIFEKFLGINELPGDCSCKSRAATSQKETFEQINSFPGQEAVIKINDVILVPGEEVVVPLILCGTCTLKAFGFDLSFPPEILEFICTESAPFSSDLVQIHANQIADGVIRAGGYSKKPVSVNSEKTLINLVFKVRKNSGSPSSLQIINKFDDFQHLTFEGGRLVFLDQTI
jgi:PKD repeat protein